MLRTGRSLSNLKDRVVAVLGAQDEPGTSVALALAREGAVLVLGGQDRHRLEALQREVEVHDGQAAVVGVHPAKRHHPSRLVETATDAFGGLDALVFAVEAGASSLSSGDLDSWERALDAGLKGFLYAISAAIPAIRERGGCLISLNKATPDPITAASQEARRVLLRELDRELSPEGIKTGEITVEEGAASEEVAREVISLLTDEKRGFSTCPTVQG